MCTPEGNAGLRHCASRLAMMSFFGISLYGGLGVCRVYSSAHARHQRHTLSSLERNEMKSAHSLILSNDCRHRSTWLANFL